MINEVKDLEDRYELKSYKRIPLALQKGKGCYVYTEEGERYLDLYGGHAVVGVGHCHPHVVSAIQEQVSELMFYSNVVYSRTRGLAARSLAEMMPEGMSHSFFVNSGAEANENAIKLARMIKGKQGIISFDGGFHGRTAAALAATGMAKIRDASKPLLPGHHYAAFGNIAEVEELLEANDIAAIILEPIQSMAGVVEADAEFFKNLRLLCNQHNCFLIYDEIQTGIGRIGEFSFAGRYGVLPDMVTFGKAIASGVPMGAVMTSDEIADAVKVGDLGTTFGGNPIACRALIATIEVMRAESLLDNVKNVSRELKKKLEESDAIVKIRGEGFLLGIEFKDKLAAEVQSYLLDRKIITGTSGHERVMRLLPPLSLKRELDDFYLAMATLR